MIENVQKRIIGCLEKGELIKRFYMIENSLAVISFCKSPPKYIASVIKLNTYRIRNKA